MLSRLNRTNLPKSLRAWMIAFLLLLPLTVATGADPDWLLFKQRFMQPEGRIVDSGRESISHSEGQGKVMLLAVYHDDRVAFDSAWQWARQNLQVRDDKLLAWKWSPKDKVKDKNNASDGDLFVVWALLRAKQKWQDPSYLAAALEIIHDVRQKLLRRSSRGIVLLPGIQGFDKQDGLVINPSYWLFPALQEIARADPAPEWPELQQTGINLLLEGHFGRWGLPADWILLQDKLAPAPGFPTRFSYDAVRIPLYLLWAKRETAELLLPFQRYWGHFKGAKFMPAWTNLNDDSIDSYDASPGIRGIAQLTLAHPNLRSVRLSALDATQDYYSSVLLLMTKMMTRERRG